MTSATVIDDPTIGWALGRAGVYEMCGLGLAEPSPAGLERLRSLAAELADHEVSRALGMGGPLAEIEAALDGVTVEELAEEHVRLFSGAVPCSPHESEYERDTSGKAPRLADIAGFYRAFGVAVSAEHRSLPDFIGTELEFMGHLCRKQALARAEGWTEREQIAGQAQRSFLADHLGRWVEAFAGELRRNVSPGPAGTFLCRIGDLTERFVGWELAVFGLEPERVRAGERSPLGPEPMECLFGDAQEASETDDPSGR